MLRIEEPVFSPKNVKVSEKEGEEKKLKWKIVKK